MLKYYIGLIIQIVAGFFLIQMADHNDYMATEIYKIIGLIIALVLGDYMRGAAVMENYEEDNDEPTENNGAAFQ